MGEFDRTSPRVVLVVTVMAARGATGRAVLGAEPAFVGEARRELRDALERAGVGPSEQQNALLVLSEVVANAVEHAARPADRVLVAWTLDRDVLKISVVDPASGPGAPVVLPLDAEREHGRGMLIVDQLVDHWDDRLIAGARKVTLRLRV